MLCGRVITPPPHRWVGRTCQGRLATSERETKHEEHGKALRNQTRGARKSPQEPNARSTEKPSAAECAGRGHLKESDWITQQTESSVCATPTNVETAPICCLVVCLLVWSALFVHHVQSCLLPSDRSPHPNDADVMTTTTSFSLRDRACRS